MKLDFWDFVRERHAIYLRRQAGEPPPWTADERLASYHFTNVYRELDPGTVFIRNELNEHAGAGLDEKILNVAVYRLCLHERSFAELGWWRFGDFSGSEWAAELASIPSPFHGAYYIHNLGLNIPKAEAMGMVADHLWRNLDSLNRAGLPGTRKEFIEGLACTKGIGAFIATQVLADLCYDGHIPYPEEGWVGLGPGALKGLALVYGEEAHSSFPDPHAALDELWGAQPAWLASTPGYKPLTRMNLQNCCCEFSKYHGHPRRRFDASERVQHQGSLGL